MKLTDIDLNNREEIAAAHALLAVILNTTALPPKEFSDCGSPPKSIGADAPDIGQRSAAEVFGQPGAAHSAAVPGALPLTNTPATPAPFVAAAGAAVGLPQGQVSGVEVDSKGMPWDERIHSGSKAKVADGQWRKKKGLNDEALVHRIEAEIRAHVAGRPDPAAMPGQAALPLPQAVPGLPVPGLMATPGLSHPPAGASASGDPQTFEQLMPRVTPYMASQQVPPNALQLACAAVGLQSIVALQQQPAFVPQVWATLKASYPVIQ